MNPEASLVFDANGNEVGKFATEYRRVRGLDSLPVWVLGAVLSVEDQHFFDHKGVYWPRVIGAVVKNVQVGGVREGFSTITMQLARNLWPDALPRGSKTLERKAAEVVVARQMEARWSKREILTRYLNTIFFGSGAYGIEAAAHSYFGKSASNLTLPEAALIAGMPKAPSATNPWRRPEQAMARRNTVLRRMVESGVISGAEGTRAMSSPLGVVASAPDAVGGTTPDWYLEAVRRQMQERFGKQLFTDGLRIETFYQPALQKEAAQVVSAHLAALGTQQASWQDLEAAVLVMDRTTGAVAAIIGGRDPLRSSFNRVMQARRPIGSLVKPWVVASALQRGWRGSSWVPDGPVSVVLPSGEVWSPRGAGRVEVIEAEQIDDSTYTEAEVVNPHVTISDLLARSRNAATVHLGLEIGVDTVTSLLERAGLLSQRSPRVPSLLLGAFEQTPWQVTKAFSSISRDDGLAVAPQLVARVRNRRGVIIWSAPDHGEAAGLDVETAARVRLLLEGPVMRGTASKAFRGMPAHHAIGKTGTTNGATDVWFMGATPQWVATVWIGHDQPRTLGNSREITGGTLAAPLWRNVITALTPLSQRTSVFPINPMVNYGGATRGFQSNPSQKDSISLELQEDSSGGPTVNVLLPNTEAPKLVVQDESSPRADAATLPEARVDETPPARSRTLKSTERSMSTVRDTIDRISRGENLGEKKSTNTRRLLGQPETRSRDSRRISTETTDAPPLGWCQGPLEQPADGGPLRRSLRRCPP